METPQNAFVPFRPEVLLRFSLRNLLVAMGAIAIAIAPAQWLGGAYLVSIAFSAGLVLACASAYRAAGPAASFGTALTGVFVSFLLVFLMTLFFLHALVNALACLVFLPLPQMRRAFTGTLCLLPICLYGYVVLNALDVHREFVAMREANPLVSLDRRLDFERPSSNDDVVTTSPAQLTPAVVEGLDELDELQKSHYYRRPWGLEQLHENFHQQFARAAGFGVSRMPGVYPGRLELQPWQPIKLPSGASALSSNATQQELDGIHRRTMYNFVDRDRMGYIRNRNAVAGFEPHGITSAAPFRKCPDDNQAVSWQITRLQLIGMLRHAEPVVYIADSLPTMDQLEAIPTRPLDEFETAALEKLVAQEDVVVDQAPEQIRMVGALRAGTSCLHCHEGERGKLLGAFSYEIVPLKTQALPPEESNPPDMFTAQLLAR